MDNLGFRTIVLFLLIVLAAYIVQRENRRRRDGCNGQDCTERCSRNHVGNEVCTSDCCPEHPFCAPNRFGCYIKKKDEDSDEARALSRELSKVLRDIVKNMWYYVVKNCTMKRSLCFLQVLNG